MIDQLLLSERSLEVELLMDHQTGTGGTDMHQLRRHHKFLEDSVDYSLMDCHQSQVKTKSEELQLV